MMVLVILVPIILATSWKQVQVWEVIQWRIYDFGSFLPVPSIISTFFQRVSIGM